MATEIERKFLVRDESWREGVRSATRYRQGYLNAGPTCSVRVRVGGDDAWLNIKGATTGATRAEFEYPIPLDEAEEILATLCGHGSVDKVRHLVEHAGRTWEVDVFAGDNAGLVVAEVELEAEDAVLELPPWAGEEVTEDPRYLNAALAMHPYGRWDPSC